MCEDGGLWCMECQESRIECGQWSIGRECVCVCVRVYVCMYVCVGVENGVWSMKSEVELMIERG